MKGFCAEDRPLAPAVRKPLTLAPALGRKGVENLKAVLEKLEAELG